MGWGRWTGRADRCGGMDVVTAPRWMRNVDEVYGGGLVNDRCQVVDGEEGV